MTGTKQNGAEATEVVPADATGRTTGPEQQRAWLPRTLAAGKSSLRDLSSSYKDAFLLLIGAAYVLGYVVWSIHAWQAHLGLLPALRAQYLLAGLLPLIIVAFVAFAVVAIRAFLEEAGKLGRGKRLLAGSLLIGLGWATVAPVIASAVESSTWSLVLLLIAEVLFLMGLAFSSYVRKGNRFRFLYEGFYAYFIPLGLGIAGIATYVLILYPHIPQELGGVRPTCGYLGLKTDDVSTSVLAATGASVTPRSQEPQKIVSTKPLKILFSGNDFVLVRRNNSAVLRIKKDAIETITDKSKRSCS